MSEQKKWKIIKKQFVTTEKMISKEKYRIIHGFRYNGLRKCFWEECGGWKKIIDMLNPNRFCAESRSQEMREIKKVDDLFIVLTTGKSRNKLRKFISRNFTTAGLLKMLIRKHGSRRISKYVPGGKDAKINAFIMTLRNPKDLFDLEKRNNESSNIVNVENMAAFTYLCGILIPIDVLKIIFTFVDPYGHINDIGELEKAGPLLIENLATVCPSFYFLTLNLFKRLTITSNNIFKIPLITLQAAKQVLVKTDKFLKDMYIHLHKNISPNVEVLIFDDGNCIEKFFTWMPTGIVYQNLRQCFISNILRSIRDKTCFPNLEEVKLRYTSRDNLTRPLSNLGMKYIRTLWITNGRQFDYRGGSILRMTQTYNRNIFNKYIEHLKLELRYERFSTLSLECMKKLTSLKKITFIDVQKFDLLNDPVYRFLLDVPTLKEIQYDVLVLPVEMTTRKRFDSPYRQQSHKYDVTRLLKIKKFEKVVINIKVSEHQFEKDWDKMKSRIQRELSIDNQKDTDYFVKNDELKRFNVLVGKYPKEGYEIRSWITKKKLSFYPIVRRNVSNYYRELVVEYTKIL